MALISFSVEQADLIKLVERLKTVEGGAKFRTALIRDLRVAVAPAVSEARSGATALSHGGASRPAGGDMGSLGAAIAAGIGTQIRLSGPRVGIKVKASKKGMPRGFKNAPNRMNRPSFEHPVFGHRGVWVVQVGNPEFFDGPLRRDKEKYRLACIAVMNQLAATIATK